MPKSCIPGYDEALAKERKFREESFLSDTVSICGVRVHQLTPFLLARLHRMETPYLRGGEASKGDTVMFLWAMSPLFVGERRNYSRTNFWRKLFRQPLLSPYASRDAFVEGLASHLFGRWEEAEEEIHEYLHETFLDAPIGSGGESVPYVSGIAWMIFRMGCPPFNWKKEETLHAPLRIIYQLMKCQDMDLGRIMYNPSDRLKARWLDFINKSQKEGRN